MNILNKNLKGVYKMEKRLKKLIKEKEQIGWYLDRKGKHLVYKHPKGGTVTIATTSSDTNMFWSVRRHFKKAESNWEN